jgi:hypothetical protein
MSSPSTSGCGCTDTAERLSAVANREQQLSDLRIAVKDQIIEHSPCWKPQ